MDWSVLGKVAVPAAVIAVAALGLAWIWLAAARMERRRRQEELRERLIRDLKAALDEADRLLDEATSRGESLHEIRHRRTVRDTLYDRLQALLAGRNL